MELRAQFSQRKRNNVKTEKQNSVSPEIGLRKLFFIPVINGERG